jgi:hypothetical protein
LEILTVEYQEDLDIKQSNYEADRAWEQKRKGDASSSNGDSRGDLALGEDIFQMFKTISADKVKTIVLLSCYAINSNNIIL